MAKTTSWDSSIYEVLLSAASSEKSIPFPIEGGSDSGLFCTVGNSIDPAQLIYHPIITSSTSSRKLPSILRPGDVILEIGDYQISGFTRLDAVKLCQSLFHSALNGDRPRVLLKLISPAALPTGVPHLSHFLSAQFQVGTPEFLLQEVTRNNIYQRVVPCTTREPGPGEKDGVDYQFLGVDRFLALEKSGQLLESGIYKGNYYGTPRPDVNSSILHIKSSVGDCGVGNSVNGDKRDPGTNAVLSNAADEILESAEQSSHQQKQQEQDLDAIALPNGWEVIDHPEFGLFYVDHIHQKTQYEPPTKADFEEAARLQALSTASTTSSENTSSKNGNSNYQQHTSSDTSDKFTDNIAQIRGPLATAVLMKGSKGFGFTIIGGSSPGHSGFLQVKNLIPGGPAAQEGTLAVGNVLVSANDINVLGFSHDQIVNLFQSIPVGGTVTLTVSQGYSLAGPDLKKPQTLPPSTRCQSTVVERSVPFAPPELCIRRLNTSPTISQLSGEEGEEALAMAKSRSGTGSDTVLTVPVAVTKQVNGFGFTLADQVGGQRVKEVLEPTGLRVGDVILEVNGTWVKDASHLEVVQLLKTCPVGKTTNFLIRRVLPASPDKNHGEVMLNSNFTRIPGCDSPFNYDGSDINDFSPTNGFYPVFHPPDSNMIQSMTTSASASSRYRSRTPGPGEESRRGTGAGTMGTLGNSSDCIYSLGESLSGLEFYRCPSPLPNTAGAGANSGLGAAGGRAGAAVLTAGLKRYGGTDFDAYCLQQGLSRSNPFGSGQLLHLNSEYESLPRRTTASPHICGEFFVHLRRDPNGFGFKLLGGSEEGTQVTIGHLAPGGAAERCGQMRAGDRLMSVNGTQVLGGSHAKALALLERAAEAHGEVTLGLWRPPPHSPAPPSTSTNGSRSTESSETRCWPTSEAAAGGEVRNVLLHRAPGEEGFGFVLASRPSKSGGSRHDTDHFISRVVAGSAADRSRLLHVGDRLLSVNGIGVPGLPREEVIRLVKASGSQLALSILPSVTPTSPSYEHMWFYNNQLCLQRQQQLNHQQQQQHRQRARAVFFQVTLFRSTRGFGFSIRGGHEFNQMPLTVLRVAEGGPAHLDGRLKVGDELLQINGFMTAGMSHRRAVEIIQAGGNMIRLGVRRVLPSAMKTKDLAAQPPAVMTAPLLAYGPFAPLPPTPSTTPTAPPPPVPPALRLPQFFTPLSVHKSSLGSRPLLSSGKDVSRQRSLITYQSLSRLWQKRYGGNGTHFSSRRNLETWANSDSSFRGTQVASNRYQPCNIQL